MNLCVRSAAAALALYVSSASAQESTLAAPQVARLELAKRIVVKMRAVEQQRYVLSKISPFFAAQVIASIRSNGSGSLQSRLGSDAGRAEVTKVLTEEFDKAFEKRLPELQVAVATALALGMSEIDLQATQTFLDTAAGASWAAAMVSAQIQGSTAGQRIGSEAGIEAVQAAMKRLESLKP